MKNKIAPNTKVEEDLITALPEELQKQFKPLLAAYKKAVEEGPTLRRALCLLRKTQLQLLLRSR